MKRKPPILTGAERERVLERLYLKYAHSSSLWQRFLYWRKKYFWIAVVKGSKFVKRLVDAVGAFFLLLLFSPLMLLITLMVKLYDGGPVLYVSKRVGLWGAEFRFPKFRSMRIGAHRERGLLKEQSDFVGEPIFKMKKDPRITPFGRILRKTSMDELPQLWCVLKGEMSLVGPRPHLVEEVQLYTLHERRRLDVKPGLTGVWQVSGRSQLPFKEQVRLDMEYIESQSLWGDIKILLKTIPAVLFGRGAY